VPPVEVVDGAPSSPVTAQSRAMTSSNAANFLPPLRVVR